MAVPRSQIQDGGPCDAFGYTSEGVNALDHEKVASRPRARCRSSSLYTRGEGPLIYFRVVFKEVQNEIQSLMV